MIAEAILCLALNVYHEARGEGPEGMAAVATVTLNRVAHPDWPDTICEVVRQPAQFSWTLGGDPPVSEPKEWTRAKRVAVDILLGERLEPVDYRAVYYHAQSVSPAWGPRMERLTQIGNHIFYGLPVSPTRSAELTHSIRPKARPEIFFSPARPKPRPENLK
jgi:N-acetylmuramoyl-L-alanine amidase